MDFGPSHFGLGISECGMVSAEYGLRKAKLKNSAAYTILLVVFSIFKKISSRIVESVGNCKAVVQAMWIARRAIHRAALPTMDRVSVFTKIATNCFWVGTVFFANKTP